MTRRAARPVELPRVVDIERRIVTLNAQITEAFGRQFEIGQSYVPKTAKVEPSATREWSRPQFIETGIPKMTGTAGQKRVPTEYFTSSPFPLPPLAEQRRIVAKVDELMARLDRLKRPAT